MSEPDSKKPPRPQVGPSGEVAGKPGAPASTGVHGAGPSSDRAALRAEREARRAQRALDGNGAGPNAVKRERPEGGRRFAAGEGPRRARERRGRDELSSRPVTPIVEDDDDTALDPEPVGPREDTGPKPAPLPMPTEATTYAATAVRQSRARRLLWRSVLLVLLPTLAGVYYYYRVASAQYESVSLLTIYSSEMIPASAAGIDALIGLGSGSSVVTDGLSVREYVFSRDILQRLETEEHFIDHYKDSSKDWVTRIKKDASFEEAYKDYEDWVRVEVDPNSGVASLSVRAYSAEAAQRFAKAIIRNAEHMVNELSRRAREDQVRFAEESLQQAETRLATARQALAKVQQERGEYNPELSAQAQLSIRTALESQVASARAELAQLQAYLTPDAPQVIGAREKVRSLAAQVAGASQRMVAKSEDGHSLNKSVAEFEAVVVEKEFATAAYQAAMGAVTVARASAARQHRYLATIAPPSLADKSTLPSRGLGVITVFLCSVLLMGIGSLLVAGVKEHARL